MVVRGIGKCEKKKVSKEAMQLSLWHVWCERDMLVFVCFVQFWRNNNNKKLYIHYM